MTPVTKLAGGQKVHSRESCINALRAYAALYGHESMTAAAFSPSTAKWRGEPEKVERYYKGNPETGERWPSLNAIKVHVGGGSFNRARELAGFPANTPGPAKNRRAAGTAEPIRDVRERVRIVYHDAPVDHAGDRELARVSAKLAKAELKLAAVGERLHDAREKAAVAQRDRRAAVAREAALSREVDRLKVAEKPKATVRVLTERIPVEDPKTKRKLDEALAAQAGLRARVAELEGDVAAAAELSALTDPHEAALVRAEALEARTRAAAARSEALEAKEDANAARAGERAALRARDVAEREAARETRARVEIQNAVAGHSRPLTAAEVAELRGKGPAGGPVFAAAVKKVVKAHGRAEKQAALREVAAAAVRWSERL